MTEKELEHIAFETLEHSEVKITGEIPWEYVEKHRATAVARLAKNVKLDGFRDGKIPEKALVAKIGDMALLQEMANIALSREYANILALKKIDAIGYPSISLTKLALGNPLGFIAVQAVMPEVKLPDYMGLAKEINAKKESEEVTDADVEKQIADILKQKASYERMQQLATLKGEENEAEAKSVGEAELTIPPLTDELAKTVGQPGQFADALDFKAKIREHLAIQKKEEIASKHRAAITDTIIEKTDMVLPQILIDSEISQMFGQMESDLERAQLKVEDYLTHMKKTREDMRREWTPNAEKRAKLQLVLNEIAKVENIAPDAERLTEEVKGLLSHHKDADESRVRTYVASVLTNDAVMTFLEKA